jgi:hypothetical protein
MKIGTETELQKKTEEQKLAPRPFFVDMKANVYSVLGSPDKLSDDSWNAAIGVVSHGQKTVRLEHFQVERSTSDKELSTFVGTFIEALRSNEVFDTFGLIVQIIPISRS